MPDNVELKLKDKLYEKMRVLLELQSNMKQIYVISKFIQDPEKLDLSFAITKQPQFNSFHSASLKCIKLALEYGKNNPRQVYNAKSKVFSNYSELEIQEFFTEFIKNEYYLSRQGLAIVQAEKISIVVHSTNFQNNNSFSRKFLNNFITELSGDNYSNFFIQLWQVAGMDNYNRDIEKVAAKRNISLEDKIQYLNKENDKARNKFVSFLNDRVIALVKLSHTLILQLGSYKILQEFDTNILENLRIALMPLDKKVDEEIDEKNLVCLENIFSQQDAIILRNFVQNLQCETQIFDQINTKSNISQEIICQLSKLSSAQIKESIAKINNNFSLDGKKKSVTITDIKFLSICAQLQQEKKVAKILTQAIELLDTIETASARVHFFYKKTNHYLFNKEERIEYGFFNVPLTYLEYNSYTAYLTTKIIPAKKEINADQYIENLIYHISNQNNINDVITDLEKTKKVDQIKFKNKKVLQKIKLFLLSILIFLFFPLMIIQLLNNYVIFLLKNKIENIDLKSVSICVIIFCIVTFIILMIVLPSIYQTSLILIILNAVIFSFVINLFFFGLLFLIVLPIFIVLIQKIGKLFNYIFTKILSSIFLITGVNTEKKVTVNIFSAFVLIKDYLLDTKNVCASLLYSKIYKVKNDYIHVINNKFIQILLDYSNSPKKEIFFKRLFFVANNYHAYGKKYLKRLPHKYLTEAQPKETKKHNKTNKMFTRIKEIFTCNSQENTERILSKIDIIFGIGQNIMIHIFEYVGFPFILSNLKLEKYNNIVYEFTTDYIGNIDPDNAYPENTIDSNKDDFSLAQASSSFTP